MNLLDLYRLELINIFRDNKLFFSEVHTINNNNYFAISEVKNY